MFPHSHSSRLQSGCLLSLCATRTLTDYTVLDFIRMPARSNLREDMMTSTGYPHKLPLKRPQRKQLFKTTTSDSALDNITNGQTSRGQNKDLHKGLLSATTISGTPGRICYPAVGLCGGGVPLKPEPPDAADCGRQRETIQPSWPTFTSLTAVTATACGPPLFILS